MKYTAIFVACLFFLIATQAQAQRTRKTNLPRSVYKYRNWHGAYSFIVGGGFCSYFGDLKDNRTDLWAKPSIQAGVQYRVNNRLHLRSELTWYRISGADSLNDPGTGIHNRNLSFRSDNLEVSAVALVHLFNKYSPVRPPINAYLVGGVGFSTNNPRAYYQGGWYNLRPLQTEGVAYNNVVLVLPAGAGLAYHVNNNWDILLEYCYRFTFTDYLDDVSTSFVGVDHFEDPLARALSDRRPEMGLPPLPAGNIRGNSGVNDWYLIMSLKLVYTPTIKPKGLREIECKFYN